MVRKLSKIEKDILKSTEEFAKANDIHYDEMTRNMIFNALREYQVQTDSFELNKPKDILPEPSTTSLMIAMLESQLKVEKARVVYYYGKDYNGKENWLTEELERQLKELKG